MTDYTDREYDATHGEADPPPYPDFVAGVIELVEVGPFPIYFGNVNTAMGLRGHYHTAEVRVVYETLGQHGYPSFELTNDEIRGKLRYLTDGIFRDATNEDVARRMWKAFDGWVPDEWKPWGGEYRLYTLHLDVQGVQDDIGHDPSVTRYTITRQAFGREEPAL